MSRVNDQNKRIIAQFTAQSKHFDSPDYTLSNQECLAWAVQCMPLWPKAHVIDVAAGTGLLSLAVSPHVHTVTAIDITQAMLDEGQRSAASKEISNVTFRLGDAYHLSETDTYDIAVSRIAFHHLTAPAKVLQQMICAVHPGGHVVIFDLLSPDDMDLATRYNALERLRDDSHTVSLKSTELISMFESCALLDISVAYRRVVNDLEAWMAMTDTPAKNREIIREAMDKELSGGSETGFHPFFGEDGHIKFAHNWMMIRGQKANA